MNNLILVKYKNLSAHVSENDFSSIKNRLRSKSKSELEMFIKSVISCLERQVVKVDKKEYISPQERIDTATDIAIFCVYTSSIMRYVND